PADLDQQAQVPVVPFPDAVLSALMPMAEAVVEEEAAKSPMATKVNESFKKFSKEIGTWGSISEKAYYNGIMKKYSLKG
ncbi:MAG: ABC transporter substrate-binding protein, partial [Desulfobacterales bacterium]|nr:ABC transporter substrate-binding protein [Desulfobacterales bacterium]MDX2512081.1 ABC transporter substrate-binding protein [Desulfobacterales bacterium]